jgi:hypothetical protein
MVKLLTPIMLVLLCSCGSNRKLQPPIERKSAEAPRPVTSVYRITATVIPESLLVRAQVEIDVQNVSADTVTSLTIIQPLAVAGKNKSGGRSSRVERLALNGSEIQLDSVSFSSSNIPIPLATPLRHSERAALSLSMVARIDDAGRPTYKYAECLQYSGWLPFVVLGELKPGHAELPAPDPADFEVSLTIDSGWFVVAPGELLNTKALFGVLPNFDTVMVDVIHAPYIADGYTFSRLPSERGRDTYVLRKRYNRGYDFLILKGYLLDRARSGDYSIDAYYPDELRSRWQYRLIDIGVVNLKNRVFVGRLNSSESLKLVFGGKRSPWLAPDILLLTR